MNWYKSAKPDSDVMKDMANSIDEFASNKKNGGNLSIQFAADFEDYNDRKSLGLDAEFYLKRMKKTAKDILKFDIADKYKILLQRLLNV